MRCDMFARSSCSRWRSVCSRCSCTTSICAASCGEIAHARPEWLVLSLATMFVNLAIRALRWQYLLEPLGNDQLRELRFARRRSALRRAACCRPRRRGHPAVFSVATRSRQRDGRVRDDHPRAAARHGDGAGAARVVRVRLRPRSCARRIRWRSPAVKWAGARRRRPSALVGARRAVRAGRPSRNACTRCSTRARTACCRRGLPGCSARIAEKFVAGLGGDPPARAACSSRWSGRFRSGCGSASASGRSPWPSALRCRSPARFC